MEVIYHRQFSFFFVWVVYSLQISQKPEPEFRVIIQELHNFEVHIFWRFKSKHAIWFFKVRELVTKPFYELLFYRFIRKHILVSRLSFLVSRFHAKAQSFAKKSCLSSLVSRF